MKNKFVGSHRAPLWQVRFESRPPSHQNAVDAIPGWSNGFPESFGLSAGDTFLYDDQRIHWAIEQYGNLNGKRVLELGPLEASHTSILDRTNPEFIDCIEANRYAFFKCLVAKEIYGLKHARFFLGNFIPWLQQDGVFYDLIVASGVLYHMTDPVAFLELLSKRSNAIYLWTHYVSDDAMPLADPRRGALLGRTHVVESRGTAVHLHARSYHGAARADIFSGGAQDLHYWMEKPDIVTLLHAFGFDDVRMTHDHPEHPNGPAVSIFARRRG